MKVLGTVKDVRAASRELRRGGTLGLVPTMGALHEGHVSLVRAAKDRCDAVAVSIFVNPAQFGPNEDLAKYPRTMEQDLRLLEAEGVDLVFAPTPEEIYPSGKPTTFVEVAGIGERLDGASRPGHFRGVTTVVSKLFHAVEPDMAFFGQKDAAQVAVLQAMVRDLDFGLEMVVCPTVREADGLALSSRNRYLSAEERARALVLWRALQAGQDAAARGCDGSCISSQMRAVLEAEPGVRVDYAEAVDARTLLPVEDVHSGALLAVAAWVGATRLIDNLVLPAVSR